MSHFSRCSGARGAQRGATRPAPEPSAILREPPNGPLFERDDEEDPDVRSRTYQPNNRRRHRKHGFRVWMRTPGGPVDPGATAREGPDAAVRVGTSTSADRVAPDPVLRPGISRRTGGSVCRPRGRVGSVRCRPADRWRGASATGPGGSSGRVARARSTRSRTDTTSLWSQGPRSSGPDAGTGGGGCGVALARAGDPDVNHAPHRLTAALARLALLGLIRWYRVTLSGWLGGQCRRFYRHLLALRRGRGSGCTERSAAPSMAAWRIRHR